MPKKLPVIAPSAPDPKITAERLLKTVLPEDLYLSLTAIGQFSCEIHGHGYTFKRNSKTIFEQDGRKYSCCIDVEDVQRPDQDRIVAEYLLALNDEKKYLETANLTEIPNGVQSGAALAYDYAYGRTFAVHQAYQIRTAQIAMEQREALQLALPPIGREVNQAYNQAWIDEEVNARRDLGRPVYMPYASAQQGPPAQIAPQIVPQRQNTIHISQIANECLSRLVQHERMRGLRYYNIPQPQCRYPDVVWVEESIVEVNFEQHRAEMFQYLIGHLVERMSRVLFDRPILAIFDLGTFQYRNLRPESSALVSDPHSGLALRLDKSFDRDRQCWTYVLAIGVERPPV